MRQGKPPEAPGEAVPQRQATEAEAEFWEGVKDSTDPDEVALYIEQFPHGAFVEQARRKIAELGGKAG